MENAPFSSVWGTVTHVEQDPQSAGHVLVIVAGQVLRFERNTNEDGLQALGILSKLTKRGETVFLIFQESWVKGSDILHACWKNPDGRMVRKLQPFVPEGYKSIREQVPRCAGQKLAPTWKRWGKKK